MVSGTRKPDIVAANSAALHSRPLSGQDLRKGAYLPWQLSTVHFSNSTHFHLGLANTTYTLFRMFKYSFAARKLNWANECLFLSEQEAHI